MYYIYFLINEFKNKTYTGFTRDLNKRIKEHHNKKVRSTRNFGNFSRFILEEVENLAQARIREKYWKSCAGRKKLKKLFE